MKTSVRHIHHRLAASVLFAVLALALAGCSRDEFADDPAANDPANSRELVQVSFRARVDQPQTRAGFVPNYGINETTGDVDWTMGEKFEWKAGDEISLYIDQLAGEVGRGNKFTIDKIDGSYATFTGSIPSECLGQKKSIYALSPFQWYSADSDTFAPEKLSIYNSYYSLYMWAKLENFNIPADGNLSGAMLNFQHLTSLLRFHVKNTDTKGNTYSVVSIQMAEEGSNKQIYKSLTADLTNANPRLKPYYDDGSPVPNVKMNIGSIPLGVNKWADYTLAIPPQTPRTAVGDKLVLILVLQDQKGNYLSRRIEIDHTSPLLQNGFEVGQRYYFNIAINSDNLLGGLEEDVIEVASPGTLFILPGTKKITVTGELNQVDFETIRDAAKNSTLREVDLSGATVTGSSYANFQESPITTFIFPKQMVDMPYFGRSNLTGSLVISEGITDLPTHSFYYCESLAGTLTLPNTIKYIRKNAFQGTPLSGKLEIPGSCELIGENAFGRCGFTSLKLNEGLKTIEYAGFCNNYFTGTLTIPSTVESIGSAAFNNFIPPWDSSTASFSAIKILRTVGVISCQGKPLPVVPIYVPMALLDAYKNDATWNKWGYTFIGYDEKTPAPF